MKESKEVAATEQQPETNGKAGGPVAEFDALKSEVQKVLPTHITVDKFMRVVLTAVASNPELLRADRRSLLTSAVKAATDGLVPDGREGAFVTFYDKQLQAQKVQWMPMVAGVLKKIRNSGELLSLTSNVVCKNDEFRYWIDDTGEHIVHEPNVLAEDRGPFQAVYAVAKTKDGGVYTEVMSRQQVEQVRGISRAKDGGPWSQWYDEMARKTVIRRLSKRLPMSTDLEAVIQRDDELYDVAAPTESNAFDALKKRIGAPTPAADEPESYGGTTE